MKEILPKEQIQELSKLLTVDERANLLSEEDYIKVVGEKKILNHIDLEIIEKFIEERKKNLPKS